MALSQLNRPSCFEFSGKSISEFLRHVGSSTLILNRSTFAAILDVIVRGRLLTFSHFVTTFIDCTVVCASVIFHQLIFIHHACTLMSLGVKVWTAAMTTSLLTRTHQWIMPPNSKEPLLHLFLECKRKTTSLSQRWRKFVKKLIHFIRYLIKVVKTLASFLELLDPENL